MKLKIKSADPAVPDKEITAASGEKVPITPGDTISFPEENPVAAVPQGNDLVVFFADGSSIVLEGFFVFGPDEDPAMIDLGEGNSFSADYGFQADDGPIGFLFGTESAVGYEPFPLGELGTIGGLNGLVTLGISEFIALRSLSDQLADVGEVLEIPVTALPCMDGGTFSGSGLVSGTDCNDILIATSNSGNVLSAFGGNDILQVSRAGDVVGNVLNGGEGNDFSLVESSDEDVDFNTLAGEPGSGNDTFRLRALAFDGDVRSNVISGGAGDDFADFDAGDDVASNTVDLEDGDDTISVNSDDIVSNVFNVGEGDDSVAADATEDSSLNVFNGGGGDDFLSARATFGATNNSFDGGEGADILSAYALLNVDGNTLMGGDGTGLDQIILQAGVDILRNVADGEMGPDLIIVGRDAVLGILDPGSPLIGTSQDIVGNSLHGGEGDFQDTLFVLSSDDAFLNTLRGGGGDDSLRLVTADDATMNGLFGDDGDDVIFVSAGDPANALSTGDNAQNTLDGGLGADQITAQSTDDDVSSNLLIGGPGDFRDILRVTAFDELRNNSLDGGPGNDNLVADSQKDNSGNSLSGGDGNDLIAALTTGEDGDLRSNTLRGGEGDDLLDVEVQTTLGLADIEFNALYGEGGNDSLNLNVGPDQTVQNALGLNVFDGGDHDIGGGDTLRIFDGGNIESSGQVANIEVLDINNFEMVDTLMLPFLNAVNLDSQEVADIVGGGDSTLRIVGNGGATPEENDSICINLRDWTEIVDGGAPGFRLFQDAGGSSVFLEVQDDLRFTIIGEGELTDILFGDSLPLFGTGGNDTLAITSGEPDHNTLRGLGGSDSLVISASLLADSNSLVGDEDSPVGDDSLTACNGNDTVGIRGAGLMIDNVLEGGDGNDFIFVTSTAGNVGRNELDGDDVYGNDMLLLRTDGDFGTVYSNLLDGGDGRDILSALTFGLSGDLFGNSLDGGDGNDEITAQATGAGSRIFQNSIEGDDGADKVLLDAAAGLENNTVTGDGGGDELRGLAGTSARGNSLTGGVGEDRDVLLLNAGTFADGNLLNGGEGPDSLVLETALGDATMNQLLGGGLSAIDSDLANADRDHLVVRSQAGNVLSNILDGGTGADSLIVDAVAGEASMNILSGGVVTADALGISDGDQDTLVVRAFGSANMNVLDSGEGADSLLVQGAAGAAGEVSMNNLNGGGGNDTLGIMSGRSAIGNSLFGGDGTDLLYLDADTSLQSIQETLDGNTIDGGMSDPGIGDTLRIEGAGDITSPGNVSEIEVLDIANGASNLIDLDTMDVLAMAGETTVMTGEDPVVATTFRALTIFGDGPGDTVVIDPAQWTLVPIPVAAPLPGFIVFQDIGATGVQLRVDGSLTLSAPVAPSPLAGGAGGAEVGLEALGGGEAIPEIDFDALAWQDGSLPGGEADGLGSLQGGEQEILVGVEEVLDFAGTEYAGAFAAIEAGGWGGDGNLATTAAAGDAASVAFGAPEMAFAPGAGVSSLLDLDAPPDDGLGVA